MTGLTAMSESDIRLALHSKRLRYHKLHPETLVINELGLAHARSRIDVAVINGHIHGYEIKSAQDNLGRLNKQLEIYQQALHKLTIVAASKHVMRIQSNVPDWCGIIEAKQEPRLTRQDYSPKVLADQFHAKPSEIRRFLNGQLDAGRTRELADRMRAVGLAL